MRARVTPAAVTLGVVLCLAAGAGNASAAIPERVRVRQAHDAALRLSEAAARLEVTANDLLTTREVLPESWRRIVGAASMTEASLEFFISLRSQLLQGDVLKLVDAMADHLEALAEQKDQLQEQLKGQQDREELLGILESVSATAQDIGVVSTEIAEILLPCTEFPCR